MSRTETTEECTSPSRHWGLKHDRQKGYRVGLGTSSPTLVGKLKAWIWQLELPCVAVYRLGQFAHEFRRKNIILSLLAYLFYLPLQALIRLLLHVDIAPGCRIGPALHLGHPFTIVVGPTTIGSNCSLTHNVTIGMGLSAERMGIPTLGDNVWVGPNAVLTGPIHVGDGATVAAGSIVSRDVPPGALVMGNPARVVLAKYDNSALLGYRLPETSPTKDVSSIDEEGESLGAKDENPDQPLGLGNPQTGGHHAQAERSAH